MKFRKRTDYLIDPFLRPPICLLIISVSMIVIGAMAWEIKIYDFVKLTDEEDQQRIVMSLALMGGGCFITVCGLIWFFRSRKMMFYYMKQTHYSSSGQLNICDPSGSSNKISYKNTKIS